MDPADGLIPANGGDESTPVLRAEQPVTQITKKFEFSICIACASIREQHDFHLTSLTSKCHLGFWIALILGFLVFPMPMHPIWICLGAAMTGWLSNEADKIYTNLF